QKATALKLFAVTTLLLYLVLPLSLFGQADSTSADTLVIEYEPTPLDSVVIKLSDDAESDAEEKEKPLVKIQPWEFHGPLGARTTATDSSLRWQIWPDWTHKLSREPGVISYRLGTNLRSNVVQRFAHEPRHQQLYWGDISLNDPVSGIARWWLVPQHKIDQMYSHDLGTQYRNTFHLRQYYLNKPLSRLIYRESKFSHRSLQFEVSHNLSRRLNIELSYWDRRAGGEYANSEVTGRQIFTKASYHMDERHYFKLNYVNNKLDAGEPFGYIVDDPRYFSFDRYNATAKRSSGGSITVDNLLSFNFYRRNADTTDATDDFHAGLYQRSVKRELSYQADSTAYHIRTLGAFARKWWSLGLLDSEAGLGYEYAINGNTADTVLATDNWGLFKGDFRLSAGLTSYFTLQADGAFRRRSTGHGSGRIGAEADIQAGGFTLSPGVSSGTLMPTPQQLYWQSESFSGNEKLGNEKVKEARATLKYQLNPGTAIGARIQYKNITDGIMVGRDSTFTNIDPYASQSATAFFEWEGTHFEFNGSATLHQFTGKLSSETMPVHLSEDPRVWFKGGAYWKGYLFNRATYVKAGVSGMISPSRYQSEHYNPELDFWQPASNDQQLPVFNNLDVDLSARIRSIIF